MPIPECRHVSVRKKEKKVEEEKKELINFSLI